MKEEWIEGQIYKGIEFSKKALEYFDDYRDSFDVSIPAREIAEACESEVAEAQEQYGKSEEVVLLQAKQLSEAYERLADAKMTIDVLKEAIRMREEMEGAQAAVMTDALTLASLWIGGVAGGATIHGSETRRVQEEIRSALSTTPKVLCKAEAWAYHKPHHGWQLCIKRGGGSDGIDRAWPVSQEPLSFHGQHGTVYILADQGEE